MSMHKPTRMPSGYATRETRQQAVQRVLAGESPEAVIRELGFHRSRIYAWLKDPKNRKVDMPHSISAGTVASAGKQASPPVSTDSMEEWIYILHQSLLDPRYPLSDFLKRLGESIGGPAVIAADLYNPAAVFRAVYEQSRLDSTIALNKGVSRTWHDNPFSSAFTRAGQILLLDEIISRDKWAKNDYCRHISAAGAQNAIALSFSGPEQRLGGLFIYQWQPMAFEEKLRPFLQRLFPHLQIAIMLLANQWNSSYTVKALEEATDHLDIAAVVLDGNGRIMKCSGAAKEMLERKNIIKEYHQQLRFLRSGDQQAFQQAVAKSITWRREPVGNKPVDAMRFTSASGQAIGVLVQPITPPSLLIPHAIEISPHVIVYLSDPNKPRQSPQQQLIMRLFGLTSREANLTTLISDGHSLAEAAKIMNVTQATARTYLQHIYEKVGVNRRQELVQRVMKSVAVLV